MGNRRERSTELAIRMVTDTVHTEWLHQMTTSLLQLDIKGAFDTVNHIRLLDTMRRKRYPPWVVRWLRSYLDNRTVRLRFDGEESGDIPIIAGVPQGSPLSPILFILYIATLYEALASSPGLIVVGFADDTNLMTVGRDVQANCRRLENAWRICERWARSRGMEFAPQKSELMHFTRAHNPLRNKVQLSDAEVAPKESARFLGVWLDRKLRWRSHLTKIKAKMETQVYALTKIAASTWGCSLARAREVYTKAIRSAIAYGASAYHTPADPQKQSPRGIARQLLTTQSSCLRVVAGAYRATPVRSLETETWVPPLDIYLSKRVADFEARLVSTGKAELLRNTRGAVATAIRNRRTRRDSRLTTTNPVPTDGTEARAAWAVGWVGTGHTRRRTGTRLARKMAANNGQGNV
jgi:Reverse transcriptase (RNA-dependent DNA polymerase)